MVSQRIYVLMQSSSGDVLQDCKDVGSGHEASVSADNLSAPFLISSVLLPVHR